MTGCTEHADPECLCDVVVGEPAPIVWPLPRWMRLMDRADAGQLCDAWSVGSELIDRADQMVEATDYLVGRHFARDEAERLVYDAIAVLIAGGNVWDDEPEGVDRSTYLGLMKRLGGVPRSRVGAQILRPLVERYAEEGLTLSEVRARLKDDHGLEPTKAKVYSYMRADRRKARQ